MTRDRWTLFDSGPGHPFMNMAIDEAFMENPRECPGMLLRLYAWDPPGLSLGYFQAHGEMAENIAVKECGALITRRITGGDAILHFNELTFALIGDETYPPFDGNVESSYHQIHLALAEGFSRMGIDACLRTQPDAELSHPEGEQTRGRCFYAVTRYDLVAGSGKLVGSAQRRTRGRVLHHGSIPLLPNPMTPRAADLSTLMGRTVTYDEAAKAVKSGFEDHLGISFGKSLAHPPAAIAAAGKELAFEKYGAGVWIKRK